MVARQHFSLSRRYHPRVELKGDVVEEEDVEEEEKLDEVEIDE